MAWTLPPIAVTGAVIQASWGNAVRSSLDDVGGIDHVWSVLQTVVDDVPWTWGTDNNWAVLNRASSLGANTPLANVLVGSPVTPAIAADSLIISSIIEGDVLMAARRGANSEAFLHYDGSVGTLYLMARGVVFLTLTGGGNLIVGTASAPATLHGLDMSTLATGDVLYATAAATLGRVGIVDDGDVLTLVSGLPAWVTPSPGYSDAEAIAAVEGEGSLVLTGTLGIGGAVTLGENSIILDESIGTDLKWSGFACAGVAGATLAVGDLIRLQDTDNEWLKTDADGEATAKGLLGICISAGTDGNPFNVLLWGFVRADAKYAFATGGAPLFMSVTAGAMSETAPVGSGDIVRIVGYAHDDPDTIFFCPDSTFTELV